MFRIKKSYAIPLLVSLLLVTAVLHVTGCGGSATEDTAVTEEPEESTLPADDDGTSSRTPPEGTQVQMMGIDMEELGGILGIEAEELEDAFSKAMEETFSAEGTFPGEGTTDGQPPEGFNGEQPPEDFNGEPPEFDGESPEGMPDGERPEDMPEGERPEGGFGRQTGISEEVLTRVAEILNIDLQELEDAISQLGNQAP